MTDEKDAIPESPLNELEELGELLNLAQMNFVVPKTTGNRTKSKAKASVPRNEIFVESTNEEVYMPVITAKDYEYGMSFSDADRPAYLEALAKKTEYKDGVLYVEGLPFSKARLKELSTRKDIDKIDLPLLRVLYEIIWTDFRYKVQQDGINAYMEDSVVHIYVPELARRLGIKSHLNKTHINSLIDKVSSFQNIVGLLKDQGGDENGESIWPVLLFEGYDHQTNMIHFTSPYMRNLINIIFKASLVRNDSGAIVLRSDGTPQLKAAYSTLVLSSIAKEKNKIAIEIVCEVIRVIERTGGDGRRIPHISAKTIVTRIPQFVERINNAGLTKNPKSNQNLTLKRAFQKAWELLRTHTLLEKTYRNIHLPDPNNPADIPTVDTLDTLVYDFKHSGKIKK